MHGTQTFLQITDGAHRAETFLAAKKFKGLVFLFYGANTHNGLPLAELLLALLLHGLLQIRNALQRQA